MYPELFHVHNTFFEFVMRSYTTCLVVAMGIAGYGVFRSVMKTGFNRKTTVILTILTGISSIIGARVFHILTNISQYQRNPPLMISFDFNGLSLIGAFIATVIIGIVISKNTSRSIWKISDNAIVYIGIGIALAKLGCFLHGCCFGTISNLPWAVSFPAFSQVHLYQMLHNETNLLISRSVHPTQLYEAFGAFAGIVVALIMNRIIPALGIKTLVFIFVITFIRILIHNVRVFPESFLPAEIYIQQLYAVIIALCMFAIWKINRGRNT